MMAQLISVIMMIETGGHPDPLNAVGDNGRSIGCMQIQMCVIEDVNRVYKRHNYVAKDRYDKVKSQEICYLYLLHWGNHYENKTGKKATSQVLARIWNGGPNGWKKASTKEYGMKAKNLLLNR